MSPSHPRSLSSQSPILSEVERLYLKDAENILARVPPLPSYPGEI